VCREIRDRACVRYVEEVTDKKKGPTRVREAQPGCTAETSSADHCENDHCDVTIGGKTYCSQCATGFVPINGTCIDESGQDAKCTTNTKGVCLSGSDGYFLYSNGCYAIGGTPGSSICADPAPTNPTDPAGKCATCAAGYFKNPTAAGAAVPPCIACNDTTGDNTNKGKLGCATCEAPTSGDTATCTACLGGFFGTESDDLTCTACDNACATCTGAGDTKCTSCKDISLYFKKGDDETGECVAEADCNGNYFPNDDVDGKKQCIPCGDSAHGGIDGCTTCTPKAAAGLAEAPSVTCTACTSHEKPNIAGTGCFACSVDGCSNCSKDEEIYSTHRLLSAALLGPSPAGRPEISRIMRSLYGHPEAKVGLE
ncbi:Variant-specific surface protein, partial [Giardia duodenalis]